MNRAFFEWWKKVVGFEGTLTQWRANPANRRHDLGGVTHLGVTWKTYKKLRPNGTRAQFAAMTPADVMQIARGFFKSSGAHRIDNIGVAILIAESYWGGFSKDALNRALARVGQAQNAQQRSLTDATVAAINAANPHKLINAIVKERLEYHRRIVVSKPAQGVFLTGWNNRFKRRWVQAKLLTRRSKSAARWLNGQSREVLRNVFFNWLSTKELAKLHRAAVKHPKVGKNSRFAKMTKRYNIFYKFAKFMKKGNWEQAALHLNGASAGDIRSRLVKLNARQISQLHSAAVSSIGAQSQLAKMTRASEAVGEFFEWPRQQPL